MCNCYDEIKTKVVNFTKEKLPPGSEKFELDMGGYVFGVTDSGLTHRAAMPLTYTFMAPKKSGGMKKVTTKTFMRASYCPFCGKAYSESEAAAS